MTSLSASRPGSLTLAGVLLTVLCLAGVCLADAGAAPYAFLALAAAAVFVTCAINGWVGLWLWLWVISFGMVDRWFWVLELPGFFNLSLPRLLLVGILGMFVVHFAVRREPVRLGGSVTGMMAIVLAYVGLSATVAGWTVSVAEVSSAPYYRYLAGMAFPFAAFFLTYNAAREDRHVKWGLVLVAGYGFYALYVAYIQGLALLGGPNLRELIWPSYINTQAEGMIHYDRARGAFPGAGPQAILLVFLFYLDLYLMRKARGLWRPLLAAQAILALPALVFTGIRAGYVSFAVCGVIWCLLGIRGYGGRVKLSLSALALLLAVLMHWSAVTSEDRLRGGVAQERPVMARLLLLRQTGRLFAREPLFGVGFGHFVSAQRRLPADPAGLSLYGTGTLVEHNIFLNMLAETGAVGLVIYIGLFVALVRVSVRHWRALPRAPDRPGRYVNRTLIVLLWVAAANYLVSGMFRDVLWDPFGNALLWTLAGTTLGATAAAVRSRGPGPPAAEEKERAEMAGRVT
jgi:O-antigen ligase